MMSKSVVFVIVMRVPKFLEPSILKVTNLAVSQLDLAGAKSASRVANEGCWDMISAQTSFASWT